MVKINKYMLKKSQATAFTFMLLSGSPVLQKSEPGARACELLVASWVCVSLRLGAQR